MDSESILDFMLYLKLRVEQRDIILERFSPGDCKQIDDTIHLGNIAEKTLHYIMYNVKNSFDDAALALANNQYFNPSFIQ